MTLLSCTNPIDANPDISGVGIRVSAYILAFLGLLQYAVAFADRTITAEESKAIHETNTNTLLGGSALLISTFIQAFTAGITVYDALIVLNLSWINSLTSTANALLIDSESEGGQIRIVQRRNPMKTIPYVLSSVHLCLMAALGLWVWGDIADFGSRPDCTPATLTTFFGHGIPVNSKPFRVISIIFYTIVAFPWLNTFPLILTALVTGLFTFVVLVVTVLHIVVLAMFLNFLCFLVFCLLTFILAVLGLNRAADAFSSHTEAAFNFINDKLTNVDYQWYSINSMWSAAGIALLTLLFALDTELMIRRNTAILRATAGSPWGLGQVLAMLLVIGPAISVCKSCIASLRPVYHEYRSRNSPAVSDGEQEKRDQGRGDELGVIEASV